MHKLDWNTNGNQISVNEWFGATNTSTIPLEIQHRANQPINIRTNNTLRAQFTTGGTFGSGTTQGDGLRFFDPSGGSGNLDLWTSASQQTHIRWDGSGIIQGMNNRFEMIGNFNGLWFNSSASGARYIFNSAGTEQARIGANTFWRIGANSGSVDPTRRLEVFDASNPQLRLTQIHNTVFTDFQTTGAGHLFVNPRNGANGTNVGININSPTSKLHINSDGQNTSFLQITNQSGSGTTANDGLQMGYPTTNANNLEAQINQRENDRLNLFTNNGERIRITHIGALNNGIAFNPGNLPLNRTRIGISHNPVSPITRPLSLLHIGYNTDNSTTNDGWRPWMDVGIFNSSNSDHLYLGLKNEANGSDAVLAWGDNSDVPDNFKVVFTTPQSSLGIPSASTNGVEALRMTPTLAQGILTGIGGDPTSNPYFGGSSNPTAALEINAWGGGNNNSGLRFTDLNSFAVAGVNPGQGVLSVNPQGDVIYVKASMAPQIGNYCIDPQNPLLRHYEIPLNGFTHSFTAAPNSRDESAVNIGNIACGTQVPARLFVQQSERMGNANLHTAIAAGTIGNDLPQLTPQFGILGTLTGSTTPYLLQDPSFPWFLQMAAIQGVCSNSNNDIFTNTKTGVGVAGTSYANSTSINIGVLGYADQKALINYGVYGRAQNASSANWGGYFEGDLGYTGSLLNTSDRRLKNNINAIKSARTIINQLKPKTYHFDTANNYGIVLPKSKQFGFIAQEIETILPELVKSTFKPAIYDTTGNLIVDSITYKGVNYIALIPLLVAAFQEQQGESLSKDSIIYDLNNRLNQLEKCIAKLGICEAGNSSEISYKRNENEESSIELQEIELKNLQTIVLDQNNPNPFTEKTVIGYYLPKEVINAEIIFHNSDGKQINSAKISTRGKGEINVYAYDLSSGVYTYTLVADGIILDTKRMVKK